MEDAKSKLFKIKDQNIILIGQNSDNKIELAKEYAKSKNKAFKIFFVSNDKSQSELKNELGNFALQKGIINKVVIFINISESEMIQQAVRKMSEKTQFIFIEKSLSKLISPILSRSVIIKIPPMTKDEFLEKLRSKLKLPNLHLEDSDLNELMKYSKNNVELASLVYRISILKKKRFSKNDIAKILNISMIKEVYMNRYAFTKLYISWQEFSEYVIPLILHDFSINEEKKKKIIDKIAEIDKMSNSVNSRLLVTYAFLTIFKIKYGED